MFVAPVYVLTNVLTLTPTVHSCPHTSHILHPLTHSTATQAHVCASIQYSIVRVCVCVCRLSVWLYESGGNKGLIGRDITNPSASPILWPRRTSAPYYLEKEETPHLIKPVTGQWKAKAGAAILCLISLRKLAHF